ncbi:hypothetical protein KZ876_26240, partial [Pseudomonas aeruginosa]|nr:hypothetical protein [Pseudomonas aeruginosa]
MTCENATLPEILELSPRLEDADPGVRRLALIELADLELPEALPLLVAAPVSYTHLRAHETLMNLV